jgi:Family of unknown function (DUF6152)
VTLEGTVVKFEFVNSHSWIHLDVKMEDGKVERWKVETGSINALFRRGWRKDSLRTGDHVTIDAFRAKDGSHTANASQVKLPDGRQVSPASMRYEANIDDPEVLVRPFTIRVALKRHTEPTFQLVEHECDRDAKGVYRHPAQFLKGLTS